MRTAVHEDIELLGVPSNEVRRSLTVEQSTRSVCYSCYFQPMRENMSYCKWGLHDDGVLGEYSCESPDQIVWMARVDYVAWKLTS